MRTVPALFRPTCSQHAAVVVRAGSRWWPMPGWLLQRRHRHATPGRLWCPGQARGAAAVRARRPAL